MGAAVIPAAAAEDAAGSCRAGAACDGVTVGAGPCGLPAALAGCGLPAAIEVGGCVPGAPGSLDGGSAPSGGLTWIAIVISTVEGPAPGVPSGATTFIAVAKLDVDVTSNA